MTNKTVSAAFGVLAAVAITIAIHNAGAQTKVTNKTANAAFSVGCDYNGVTYSQGAVVCQGGHEYVCGGDGGWQSTGRDCDAKSGTLIKGQATTKYTVFAVKPGEQPATINAMSDEKQIAAQFPCVSFFSGGPGKLGIRNNCPQCKIAVVMWTPRVGVVKYSVKGYGEILVDLASATGQLIGEEPCP